MARSFRPLKSRASPLIPGASPLKFGTSPLTPRASPLPPRASPLEVGASPLAPRASPLKFGTSPLKPPASPLKFGASPLERRANPLETCARPKKMPKNGCLCPKTAILPRLALRRANSRSQNWPPVRGNGGRHSIRVKAIARLMRAMPNRAARYGKRPTTARQPRRHGQFLESSARAATQRPARLPLDLC